MFAFILIIKKCECIIISRMRSFSISSNNVISFYIVTLNFIINMPSARDSYTKKICDIILIMIDKITKHATYVIIIINLKINEFVDVL